MVDLLRQALEWCRRQPPQEVPFVEPVETEGTSEEAEGYRATEAPYDARHLILAMTGNPASFGVFWRKLGHANNFCEIVVQRDTRLKARATPDIYPRLNTGMLSIGVAASITCPPS